MKKSNSTIIWFNVICMDQKSIGKLACMQTNHTRMIKKLQKKTTFWKGLLKFGIF